MDTIVDVATRQEFEEFLAEAAAKAVRRFRSRAFDVPERDAIPMFGNPDGKHLVESSRRGPTEAWEVRERYTRLPEKYFEGRFHGLAWKGVTVAEAYYLRRGRKARRLVSAFAEWRAPKGHDVCVWCGQVDPKRESDWCCGWCGGN